MGSIPICATNGGRWISSGFCVSSPDAMSFSQRFAILAALGALLGTPCFADSNAVAVEAIRRLKGADLGASPALKSAIDKVLDQITDQSAFVDVVRDFDLKERAPQVLGFIGKHPQDPVAIDGMRWVLRHDAPRVVQALTVDAEALPLLGLAGRVGGTSMVTVITGIAGDSKRSVKVREAAVLVLVASQDGARQLLGLVTEKRLDGKLGAIGLRELQGVRWQAIRDAAEKLGSVSPTGDRLPSKVDLLKMDGDAKRGAQVFRKPELGCPSCHQINGEGIDFGPRLSEIGAKLGKDALYDAIIEPSAGISFGFESWLIVTKDGDEMLGVIASETDDDVLMKLPGGQSTRIPKKDIVKRQKQGQSIMPTGLAGTLTSVELADLLEYLASLKKASR